MHVSLTLPAIERLIGGDTELEFALRTQIAKEFVSRHIKGLVDEELAARVAKVEAHAIDAAVKEELDVDQITKGSQWPVMSQRLRCLIKSHANIIIEAAMKEELEKTIAYYKRHWTGEVVRMVDKAIEAEVAKRVEEGIQARLQVASAMLGLHAVKPNECNEKKS